MQRPSLLAVSILAGLGLAACADEPPPTPEEVRARISSDLGGVLREANAAYVGSTEASPGAAVTAVLDRMLGGDSAIALRVRGALAQLAAPRVTGGARPADAPYDPEADIAFLNEELFSDGFHVGDGVFQVSEWLVCKETTYDGEGNVFESLDPECANMWLKAQIRIRVSKSGEQLRFSLQVGEDHREPLTIGLEEHALSVTVDLGEAWHVALELDPVLGTNLNGELAGLLTGRLEILGAAHARATLAIDRAVSIAFARNGAALDGPDAYRFSSAAAKVLEVELDGQGQRGSYALGLGATAAHVLVDTLVGTQTTRDRYELDLPGLTARAAFAPGRPLELTGVSLGDRTASISRNGQRASAIDLNPEDGRALGAAIALDPVTGRETVAVSPRLDLRVAVDHAAWGEPAPIYDVTRIRLDGSVRGDATGERLEVVTGSLEVSTNPAGHGFSAAAGQCVSAAEVEDVSSGDFYTQWTVGACL